MQALGPANPRRIEQYPEERSCLGASLDHVKPKLEVLQCLDEPMLGPLNEPHRPTNAPSIVHLNQRRILDLGELLEPVLRLARQDLASLLRLNASSLELGSLVHFVTVVRTTACRRVGSALVGDRTLRSQMT